MTHSTEVKRIVTYVGLGVSLFLLFILLRHSGWQGSVQIHTLMEVSSTLLACFVGTVALVRYHTRQAGVILFIGVGFLGTALLNGYHTIATSVASGGLLDSASPSLMAWSGSTARLYLSLFMFVSLLAWRRETKYGDRGTINAKKVYATATLIVMSISFIITFYPLPPAYYSGKTFGRPEELIAALFFLLALVGYFRKGEWKKSALEHWIVLFLFVSFTYEAMFFSLSLRASDPLFGAAHILEPVSYVCILTGLLISTFHIFKRAERSIDDVAAANEYMRGEIAERETAERALARRDALLEAIDLAARRFMESSRWEEHIGEVLRRLGNAAEVSRVYIFENHCGVDQRLLTSQRHEWVGQGVAAEIGNPDLQEIDWHAAGFGRWVELMSRGDIIEGNIREFPVSEREMLEAQEIKSIAVVPVFVVRQWWGFLGFDECVAERQWSPAELEAIKLAASTLGAAIHKEDSGKRMEGVSRLTRDLLAAGLPAEKFRTITDGIVDIFKADFARIWVIGKGDRCDDGCVHARDSGPRHACTHRDKCLHLVASSGRYTHTDGKVHRRVPLGCYKIGRLGSGEEDGFLTNDVAGDPRVHDHEWAERLGLVSFAGYRLQSPSGEPTGVMALFSRRRISHDEDVLLGNVAGSLAQVIQRMQAERAREEMAALARFNPAPVIRIDRQGKITTANPAAHDLLGDVRLEGRPLAEALPPLSAIDVEEDIREGKLNRHTARIDDREYMFVTCGIPDLEIMNIYGSDITEEVREKILRSALYQISEAASSSIGLEELYGIIHEELGRLIDTGNFYIALYDPKADMYTFPYIIDEYDEVSDFTPQQLRKSLTDHVRKTGTTLLVDPAVHRRLIEEGEVEIVGEPAAQWLGAPLKGSAGVIGVVAVQSYSDPDVYGEEEIDLLTFVSDHIAMAIERKRTAENLKLSQFTIDHSSESMFWIGPDARFLRVNDHACEALGYSREELLSMAVPEIDPNFRRDVWEDQWNDLKENGTLTFETLHRTKNGREFPVEVVANYIEYEGQGFNFAYARDITERKKVERLKDEFVSTVSHELRTPLTSVHGAISLINCGKTGVLPPKARALLEIAERNSQRLRNLIDDLLDIQKIESGAMVFELKPRTLSPLIRQSLENNRSFGEQFDVEFVFNDLLDGVKVNADNDRLTQVMDNLLSNAAKYSPPHDRVEISAIRHDDRVRVTVTDHGEGIPEDFHKEVFGKFTQADGSTTREKGGTGLGLSIAKSIIEKHGGTIGFDTGLDIGTTFYFELPALEESKDS